MKPTPNDIHHALRSIENAERDPEHPRSLAHRLVAQHRASAHATPEYDFDHAPKELKRVVYGATVRFSRRRLWARLLR